MTNTSTSNSPSKSKTTRSKMINKSPWMSTTRGIYNGSTIEPRTSITSCAPHQRRWLRKGFFTQQTTPHTPKLRLGCAIWMPPTILVKHSKTSLLLWQKGEFSFLSRRLQMNRGWLRNKPQRKEINLELQTFTSSPDSTKESQSNTKLSKQKCSQITSPGGKKKLTLASPSFPLQSKLPTHPSTMMNWADNLCRCWVSLSSWLLKCWKLELHIQRYWITFPNGALSSMFCSLDSPSSSLRTTRRSSTKRTRTGIGSRRKSRWAGTSKIRITKRWSDSLRFDVFVFIWVWIMMGLWGDCFIG